MFTISSALSPSYFRVSLIPKSFLQYFVLPLCVYTVTKLHCVYTWILCRRNINFPVRVFDQEVYKDNSLSPRNREVFSVNHLLQPRSEALRDSIAARTGVLH